MLKFDNEVTCVLVNMAVDESISELESRIRKSSAYFSSLIELVPARFYEVESEDDSRHAGRKQKTPKSGKAARDLQRQLAKKAKYLKLDPGQQKSIKELQEMIEEREKALMEKSASEPEESVECQPVKISEIDSAPLSELRSKLHNRLDSFRMRRKGKNQAKAGQSEKLNNNVSRKKDKKKRKKEIKGSNLTKKQNKSEQNGVTDGATKEESVNETNSILFSNLDFGGSSKNRKRKHSDKRLLQKAVAKKQKLQKVENEDKIKAIEIKQSDNWQKALKHAEGNKVKDDPKLLKKSIKRKEKQKQKSSKQWQERTDQQKKQMDEKQKLRKQHLKERRDSKKPRKYKKK